MRELISKFCSRDVYSKCFAKSAPLISSGVFIWSAVVLFTRSSLVVAVAALFVAWGGDIMRSLPAVRCQGFRFPTSLRSRGSTLPESFRTAISIG